MSLEQYQAVLARVLTDRAFREAFVEDSAAACRGYQLREVEFQSLAGINRSPMLLHSHLLRFGRVVLALKAFPCTAQLLGAQASVIADDFCDRFPPSILDGPTLNAEAARFRAFAESGGLSRLDLPAYAVDLVRYEATLWELGADVDALESARDCIAKNASAAPLDEFSVPVHGPHVRVERFGFDVTLLARAIEACDRPGFYDEPAENVVLFVRAPDVRRPKVLKVNGDVVQLLAECDGNSTVREIARRMVDRARLRGTLKPETGAGVLAGLERLRGLNVFSYEVRVPVGGAAS